MLREPIFKVAPEAFDGIEFRRIGGKEEQCDIGRKVERGGFVKGAVIEEHQMEAGRIGRGKVLQEELKALGIEDGQFQKEPLAGDGFHGPIQIQTLKAIGSGDNRLAPPRSDALAHDGQQPAATLILHPHAPAGVALLLGSLDCAQELRRESRLKLGNGGRVFFGCERRGDLGLACSW